MNNIIPLFRLFLKFDSPNNREAHTKNEQTIELFQIHN